MKIFVISNLDGGVDNIVESFSNSEINVVAKEVSGGIEDLGRVVSDYAANKGYDFVVVVPDDPIEASINMNKHSGMRAAVCANVEDVTLAKRNRVNVIIAKGATGDFGYLVQGLLSGNKGFITKISNVGIKAPKKQPESRLREEEKTAEEGESYEEEYEEQREAGRTPRKGFMSRIKDSLGIIDER